jgi:hypothetical protein
MAPRAAAQLGFAWLARVAMAQEMCGVATCSANLSSENTERIEKVA